MTTDLLTIAAQQALEAEGCARLKEWAAIGPVQRAAVESFLAAALAQQEQEPVAWIYQNSLTDTEYLVWNKGTGGRNWVPLYTTPPRREWVGLTEDEIDAVWRKACADETLRTTAALVRAFASAVEDKLEALNHIRGTE